MAVTIVDRFSNWESLTLANGETSPALTIPNKYGLVSGDYVWNSYVKYNGKFYMAYKLDCTPDTNNIYDTSDRYPIQVVINGDKDKLTTLQILYTDWRNGGGLKDLCTVSNFQYATGVTYGD